MKAGSRDRYFQDDEYSESKLIPEGIEGRVPYRGIGHEPDSAPDRRRQGRHGPYRLPHHRRIEEKRPAFIAYHQCQFKGKPCS